MNEKELQKEVEKLLRERNLIWHHCRQSQLCTGTPGLPDLLIIGSRVLARELKGDTTRMTRPQVAWGSALARAGVSWGAWRPEDLASGRVARELDELL